MNDKYAKEFAEIYSRLDGTLHKLVEVEKEAMAKGRWFRTIDANHVEEVFDAVERIVIKHHPHLYNDPDFGILRATYYALQHHPESELLLGRHPILSYA